MWFTKNEKSPSLEQKCRGISAKLFFLSLSPCHHYPPTYTHTHPQLPPSISVFFIYLLKTALHPWIERLCLHLFVFLKHFFQPFALNHIVWVGYRFIRETLTGQKERFFANENHFLPEQADNPGEYRSLCGLKLFFCSCFFVLFFSKLITQVFIHNWGFGEAIEYA